MLKSWFCIIILFLCCEAPLKAQSFKPYKINLHSRFLTHPRSIYIYIPRELKTLSRAKLPLLIFHDGQNLYDPSRSVFGKTWNLERTLNALIEEKKIPPLVALGIDNSANRIWEYTFSTDRLQRGGGSALYLQFIVEELLPLLKKDFGSFSEISMIGSSLGGLASLHAGLLYPQIFTKIAALSPSLWWDEQKIFDLYAMASSLPSILYIDSGTEGGESPQNVMAFAQLIQRTHPGQLMIKSVIDPGAHHDEDAWAKRLPGALQFLFPNKNTTFQNTRHL